MNADLTLMTGRSGVGLSLFSVMKGNKEDAMLSPGQMELLVGWWP